MLTAQRELMEPTRRRPQLVIKARRSQEIDTQDVANKTNKSEAAQAGKKAGDDLTKILPKGGAQAEIKTEQTVGLWNLRNRVQSLIDKALDMIDVRTHEQGGEASPSDSKHHRAGAPQPAEVDYYQNERFTN
jgi:hypothetical protein